MGFSKPPGVPCPDPNKHCGDDVVSVSIDNPYLIAFCFIAILVYMLWIFKNRKV